ncbi:Coatomer subunit gamma [Entamoeba marina]
MNKPNLEDAIEYLENTIFPDKGVLYQQRSVCAEKKIDLVRCRLFLTKLIAVLNRGDVFTQDEATELFFATTKLFYSQNVPLRQLLLTTLRAIIPYACDVFVVMNSLSKDSTSRYDFQRSSALRTLKLILTDQTITTLERHFKQGIIDKTPSVSSSALSTSCVLALTHHDIVSRWMPEINTSLSSPNHMVQYHSLRLLHIIKQTDRLALIRLITVYGKQKPLRSPYAHIELLKITSKMLQNERAYSQNILPVVDYLQSCLRPNNDIVSCEAIKVATRLHLDAAPQSLSAQLMTSLQIYLQSNKALLRFIAARAAAEISVKYPDLVATVRRDIEGLLRESNRAVLTAAVTAALNIATTSSVDGLLTKIGKLLHDLPESFLTRIIRSVEDLSVRFPTKRSSIVNFLSRALSIKGRRFQSIVIGSLHRVSSLEKSTRESALGFLAEYIEDCEYADLLSSVLSVIAAEGPKANKPMKYVRAVYNRLLLEAPQIRAAAVTTIAGFAKIPGYEERIGQLLKKCAYDDDKEVRDRACFYSVYLDEKESDLKNVELDIGIENKKVNYDDVQNKLEAYLAGECNEEFDFVNAINDAVIPDEVIEEVTEVVDNSLNEFGDVLKITETPLTQAGCEYDVVVSKIICKDVVVLKYQITNTLLDYVLTDAQLVVKVVKGDYNIKEIQEIGCLLPQQSKTILVVLERGKQLIGEIENTLKYILKESEEDEFGEEDEYVLDSVNLMVSDFVAPLEVLDWNTQFDSLSSAFNQTQIFKFPAIKNIQSAVDKLVQTLQLNVVNGSDNAKKATKKHVLMLAGNLLVGAGSVTLVRIRMLCDDKGVTVELCARSNQQSIPDMLLGLL